MYHVYKEKWVTRDIQWGQKVILSGSMENKNHYYEEYIIKYHWNQDPTMIGMYVVNNTT